RQARYRFLFEVAAKYENARIALAHHMDDQGETMLLNLIRGTGLKGIGAIRPLNGRLIRPLLCLRRMDIEHFLRERNLTWCHDITNDLPHTPRNKLRLELIPELNKLGYGDIIPRLCNTADQAARDDSCLTDQAIQFCATMGRADYFFEQDEDDWVVGHRKPMLLGMHFRRDMLQQLSDAILSRVVIHMVQHLSGRVKDMTAAAVERAIEWIRQESAGGYQDICHGVSLVGEKEDVGFILFPIPDISGMIYLSSFACDWNERPVLILEPETNIWILPNTKNPIEWKSIIIYITFIENQRFIAYNNHLWIEFDIKSDESVVIRSRQPGDRYTRPRRHTRKVKQMMNEYGLPRSWRDRIALIATNQSNRIIAFPGYQDMAGKENDSTQSDRTGRRLRIDIVSRSQTDHCD
ncbi:MAG TPA: tRNA lysidine(34) synthetase TilS, partial [Clostridiaceae bacterium]|nr:tRNA lysidine(34) synthetase TilS [Clostridiaceae bacterium]